MQMTEITDETDTVEPAALYGVMLTVVVLGFT